MIDALKYVAPLAAGLAFVFVPFAWCRWRGERPEAYGLTWTLRPRAAIECALVTAFVLGGLTFVAMRWPFESLPRHSEVWRTIDLIISGVSAAVIEEVFFRGWIYPLLRKKLHFIISIAITSAIFASAHVFVASTPFMLAVFFPGCIMAALRERHGNIATPTIFHAVSNIWAVWFAPLVWPPVERLHEIFM